MAAPFSLAVRAAFRTGHLLSCHLPWLRRVPWRRLLVRTAQVGAGAAVGAVLAGEVLGRAAGWGALGPGDGSGDRVAVTFDDGPGERTPDLLSVLDRHGVKATFYVTRPAVRQYAAQFQAIREAGHELEAHGRWHRHALGLWPWREWAQVAWHPRARDSGPWQYRPPYGGHSPFTRLFAALLERQVALWDVEGRDWTGEDAHALARETLAQVRPGSVILLHDGPAVTPALLDELLTGLKARGLKAVRADELPMRRIGFRAGLRRLPRSYGA